MKGDFFRAGLRFRAGFLVAVGLSKSCEWRASQLCSSACPFWGKADIAFVDQGQCLGFPPLPITLWSGTATPEPAACSGGP